MSNLTILGVPRKSSTCTAAQHDRERHTGGNVTVLSSLKSGIAVGRWERANPILPREIVLLGTPSTWE